MIDRILLQKIVDKEQLIYGKTLYDYLPYEWRKDDETILNMCTSIAGILDKVISDSEEAISLYRELVARTGLSDVFVCTVCEESNIDSELITRVIELSPFHDPIVVIEGGDVCYGTPRALVKALGRAFEKLGEEVIYITNEGSEILQETLKKRKDRIKFFVGAQSMVLNDPYFRKMQTVPKVQLIMDNPLFLDDFFEGVNDSFFYFSQDYKYTDILKTIYGIEHAFYLPFGGDRIECGDTIKKYAVSFVGSYKPAIKNFTEWDDFEIEYYQYMIKNPNFTYDEGLINLLKSKQLYISDDKLKSMILALRKVCYEVAHYYREKMVQSILSAGIELNVFGEAWKKYDGPGKDYLCIHNELSSEEALKIYSYSIVSLNIMSWHKAGVTERVTNIMMSNAVCVSEKTSAIEKEFIIDGVNQQLLTFNLDELDKLPFIIKDILDNSSKRIKIIENAHNICAEKHTWEHKALDIYQTLLAHIEA